jgi:hypothetical protein
VGSRLRGRYPTSSRSRPASSSRRSTPTSNTPRRSVPLLRLRSPRRRWSPRRRKPSWQRTQRCALSLRPRTLRSGPHREHMLRRPVPGRNAERPAPDARQHMRAMSRCQDAFRPRHRSSLIEARMTPSETDSAAQSSGKDSLELVTTGPPSKGAEHRSRRLRTVCCRREQRRNEAIETRRHPVRSRLPPKAPAMLRASCTSSRTPARAPPTFTAS